jgi:hypothetical protein
MDAKPTAPQPSHRKQQQRQRAPYP